MDGWLLLATVCGVAALGNAGVTPQNAALGLCAAVMMASAYSIVDDTISPELEIDSAEKHLDFVEHRHTGCIRDFSLTLAIATGFATYAFEIGLARERSGSIAMSWDLLAVLLGSAKLLSTIIMISRVGSLEASSLPIYAVLGAGILLQSTGYTPFLACIFVLANAMMYTDSAPLFSGQTKSRIFAASKTGWFLAFIVVLFLATSFLTTTQLMHAAPTASSITSLTHKFSPSASLNVSLHPVQQLVHRASEDWETQQSGQSRSLAEAAQEYKSRYGLPPPPLFDRWYEFVKARDVEIIDEYDTIHDLMLPFWALKPALIRERVREAIGFEENTLIAVLIRAGKVKRIIGGQEWQRGALQGMLSSFVHFLPDMDLAFNAHDEPRIILPNDELSIVVSHAKSNITTQSLQSQDLINNFSTRPDDVDDGERIREYKISRFNEYAHQNTWIASRLSCPPQSAARDFSDDRQDEDSAFATGELGFISNQTAFSDVCLSPSFKGSHGFFDRPNAFNVAHELIPIFSESKISSFQDIVYPSLWHWYARRPAATTADMHKTSHYMYNASSDIDWDSKAETMYWRGSTTGGYSSHGGWRRQHRQQIVQKLNAPDTAKVLGHRGTNDSSSWHVYDVPRRAYKDLIDVKFSGVGQCDPGDCDAQNEFFQIRPFTDMQANWQFKHLLDLDGNAFSARFYALLKSKGLVYKMAVFREWHEEWLKPWLHYIPLSLKGTEHLETVRWFAQDEKGREVARALAETKRKWAERALRREDMEVWFFRVLLEYARVVDDGRDHIGFVG
ncbi:MAG: capsule-associated protein CAP1 [Chrysothrix sp. TS-e1954]|nr:MAG: capsule-associated protein CAP1 [Chrysothrix sp. TS-e1954]